MCLFLEETDSLLFTFILKKPYFSMFVLGRDRFFTVYIYFKETLFFNFSSKLFNKYFSLPHRALATNKFRVSLTKYAKIGMRMYIIILYYHEKAVQVPNYRFFWKRLSFNYLISSLWHKSWAF